MKFNVIVADPPYEFGDKLKMSSVKRGAEANYNIMTTEELCNLPIKQIVDPNGCILCLWCPSSLIQNGLEVMDTYGFKLKQTYIWIKSKQENSIINIITKVIPKQGWNTGVKYLFDNCLSFGMGRLFRQSHEICLIGTNNNGIYKQLENRSQRSVSFAPNLKHSQKPEDLQNSLDLMFSTGNKLEIFARRQREGWVCIGNEAPATKGEDIRVSLEKLINAK